MEKEVDRDIVNESPRKLTDPARILAYADKGDVLSMYRLGKHYLYFDIHEEGRNHEESLQALYWLSKAAQNNICEAYYWLSFEVYLLRRSMGFGGEKYFMRYRDKAAQTNPVYKDILSRLKQDGYTKETRSIICRNNMDKINTAYLFFYYFSLLYYKGYPYRSDDITSCYLTKAAEHGCIEAQKALAIGYKESWDDWCGELLSLPPTRVHEYLKDEGISITEIKGFYESAKEWFLKVSLAGEDVDREIILLLESRNNLEKLEVGKNG